MRTHRSFPSADVWLRFDRGFKRKAACSPVPLDWGSTDLEVFHQAYASSNVLQPAALSGQSFRRSGELPQGGEAEGPPPPQKSATPGTAVIARAVSHSAGAATSVPSVTRFTATSRASLTPATTAPAHPLEGGLADQPSSLAPPVSSSFMLPLACCSLPPRSSPVPCSGPFSAVLRPSLRFLALTPRSSPTRPPAWPPLPPPAAVSPIKFSVLAFELRQHPSPAFRDY